MSEMNDYLEELHTRQAGGRGRKNASKKAIARFLRSVIVESDRRIKTLMKNPTKQSVVNFGDGDGPQPTDNKELADREREVKKDAQRKLKDMQGDAPEQSKPSREKDERNKRINARKAGNYSSMRGSGGGGGSIKSPDETARGRMTLLKKKM